VWQTELGHSPLRVSTTNEMHLRFDADPFVDRPFDHTGGQRVGPKERGWRGT